MRRRRALRFAIIAAGVMVAGSGLLIWGLWLFPLHVPLVSIEAGLTRKANELLATQWGTGACVAAVSVNWREISVRDARIPLDSLGSELRIAEARLSVSLLRALLNPRAYELAATRLWIERPELSISATGSRSADSTGRWFGDIRVPSAVYEFFGRLDSLSGVEFHDGAVRLLFDRDTVDAVTAIDGSVQRTMEGMQRLSAVGNYAPRAGCRFSVMGELDASKPECVIDARIAVPNGELPLIAGNRIDLTSGGGFVAIHAEGEDSTLRISGEIHIDSLRGVVFDRTLSAGPLVARFARDTLTVEPLTVGAGPASIELAARLACLGAGAFTIRAELSADSGSVTSRAIELEAAGRLRDASAQFEFRADSVLISDYRLEQLRGRGRIRRDDLAIEDLHAMSPLGTVRADGRLGLENGNPIAFVVEQSLRDTTKVLGTEVAVRSVECAGSGTLKSPNLMLFAKDASGNVLLRASSSYHEGAFAAVLQDESGSALGTVNLIPSNSVYAASLIDTRPVMAALFQKPPVWLMNLHSAEARFQGDASGGSVQLTATLDSVSRGLLSMLARDIDFNGGYRSTMPDHYRFSGAWSGHSGDGSPFAGRAEVEYNDPELRIVQCFIDEVGSLAGGANFRDRTIGMQADIQFLPYEKFPLRTTFMDRVGLNGTLTGVVRVTGALDNPEWAASLSLIDGEILKVPGYWFNADGHGDLHRITIDRFELGRDIRGIIQASGYLDFAQDTVAIVAGASAARAEDFVLALSGRRNLISGELDAQVTVSGRSRSPTVTADVSVAAGELLGELWVDRFGGRIWSGAASDGSRVLRISQLAFSKRDVYTFSGAAEAELVGARTLSAHLEGSGDFLDLVDQVDRTFHTEGSDSRLRLDIGGTLEHPEFQGAELTVENGRFSYVDATPDPVNIAVELVVDSLQTVEGQIQLATGDSWLTVDLSEPRVVSGGRPLGSLIIPRPHLNLGIIEFHTGETGIPVTLPGFMKPDWVGTLTTGAGIGQPLTISAQSPTHLLITGDADLRNGRLTFPFLPSGSGARRPVARWLFDRLREATWDLTLNVGEGNHYDVELTNLKDSDIFAPLRGSALLSSLADYFDHLTIDAIVEPTASPLIVRQSIDSSTFYVEGQLQTRRGRVDYLDQTFQIDYASADFDATDIMPVLEGRAFTDGVDSVSRRVPVYLTMYQIDTESQSRSPRGRLDKITFVLEGGAGETPEQALSYLGYTATGAQGKAEQLVATTITRALGRQWLDPIERKLEKWTWLDEVALSPGGGQRTSITRQLVPTNERVDSLSQAGAVRFFTGSQVSVGKYLTSDVLFTYTGELAEAQRGFEAGRLGLVHFWNIEYRIKPLSRDLVLDLAVEYDEAERKRDESVSLKYSFVLEP
ncbi:translocation/assembly module TamB domain-containing protein [candidate division KSB1 bacterium]|nr:translocation/assembly module TamB domain-containing protein [candidate division KSB1 bacterium]